MWETGGDWKPDLESGSEGVMLARNAWLQGFNSFETSAAGRLFDAAACLIMNRTRASFEGQGPMELEQLASGFEDPLEVPLAKDPNGIWRSDWAPLLPVLTDESIAAGQRASIFHTTMARALVDQALTIHREFPFEAIGLSGGAFQNRLLTETVVNMLEATGLDVRLHEKIPANDGGLSFGQVIEAHALMSQKSDK
jgi:hydrogenase maturation protein HypF